MFCQEPIIKVMHLEIKEALQPKWYNSLLQITHSFEYHTTDGLWILLETENFYITIGYDGVIKYEKPYQFPLDKFDINNAGDGETSCYQEMVFVGQHICEVTTIANVITVCFDNFNLKLYTYTEKDEKWFEGRGFTHGDEIVPIGTHLLKNCSCGGQPEIYLDGVDDFFIRCKKCHKSTYADMWFKVCADAWNKSNTPITALTDTEYFDQTVKQQQIKRILVSNRHLEPCEDDSCWAEEIIIEFETVRIAVQNSCLGEEKSKLCFSYNITGYNAEIYDHIICPRVKELKYIDKYDVYGREEMLFELDDTKLTISANGQELFLSLAESWENNFVEAKRKKLFE